MNPESRTNHESRMLSGKCAEKTANEPIKIVNKLFVILEPWFVFLRQLSIPLSAYAPLLVSRLVTVLVPFHTEFTNQQT